MRDQLEKTKGSLPKVGKECGTKRMFLVTLKVLIGSPNNNSKTKAAKQSWSHKHTHTHTRTCKMDVDSPPRTPSPLPVARDRPHFQVVEPVFKFLVAVDDHLEVPVSFVGPKSFLRDVEERSLLLCVL